MAIFLQPHGTFCDHYKSSLKGHQDTWEHFTPTLAPSVVKHTHSTLTIQSVASCELHHHQIHRLCIKLATSNPVTPRPPRGRACYAWQLSRISRLASQTTLVFSAHFVLTYAHPGTTSRSVTHHQIAPGQARLTWSSFQMSFRKRRYTLLI
jgi:hypothetical protein